MILTNLTGINGIRVTGGASSIPYSTDNNNPFQGIVKCVGGSLKYFDSNINMWSILPESRPTIELTPEVQELLAWTKMKKDEEELLISLPSDHPAVETAIQNLNNAKQQLKHAEEQLKIIKILSKEQ
jgi:hypothetical protein